MWSISSSIDPKYICVCLASNVIFLTPPPVWTQARRTQNKKKQTFVQCSYNCFRKSSENEIDKWNTNSCSVNHMDGWTDQSNSRRIYNQDISWIYSRAKTPTMNLESCYQVWVRGWVKLGGERYDSSTSCRCGHRTPHTRHRVQLTPDSSSCASKEPPIVHSQHQPQPVHKVLQ